MADQVWCPTRGYFEIGGEGAAAPDEAAVPEDAAEGAAAGEAEAPSAGADDGVKVWAPTRGYFTVGGAPAKQAAPKKAAKKAAKKAPAAETKATEKAATAKPAAKKAAKKAPAKTAPAAPAAPKSDPERDSVTTVPGLTGAAVGKAAKELVFDDPDSETTLYRVPFLNIVFVFSSAALLIYTALILWQDYDRPWKSIQADWHSELTARYEKDLAAQKTEMETALAAMEPEIRSILKSVLPPYRFEQAIAAAEAIGKERGVAERVLQTLNDVREGLDLDREYVRLRDAAKQADTDFVLRDIDLRAFRGEYQAQKYVFDKRKRFALEQAGDTQSGNAAIKEIENEFRVKFDLEMEKLDSEVESLKEAKVQAEDALSEYLRGRTLQTAEGQEKSLADIEGRVGQIEFEVNKIQKSLDLVKADWRNTVRNAPLFDAFAPSFKIEKAIPKGVPENLNFLRVDRVDRCKTCHINIDDTNPDFANWHSEEWGLVYASHPRLDLFVGSSSPHPYLQFGCTTCHYGDGHSTDFTTASHTPNSKEQEEEWVKKYHWHEMHHQDFPMFKRKHVTSQCAKCHVDEHRLDGGGYYNLGYEIVREHGCYGCHKIKAFENEPKAGPSLRYIADKIDEKFMKKWVFDPKSYRESTRMPKFFGLTNSTGVMVVPGPDGQLEPIDFDLRNDVEVSAISRFLYRSSGRQTEFKYKLKGQGDVQRGREIVRTIGCLGCHSIKRESLKPGIADTDEDLDKLRATAKEQLAAILAQVGDGKSSLETRVAAAIQRAAKAQSDSQASAGVAQALVALRKLADGGADHGRGGGAHGGGRAHGLLASVRELAAKADKGFDRLAKWFVLLTVGRNIEGLYADVTLPGEKLVTASEELGTVAGELQSVAGALQGNLAYVARDLQSIATAITGQLIPAITTADEGIKASANGYYNRWIHNHYAPDLSTVGSKIKSPEWLADWIVNPRAHDGWTIMPRLRLEEGDEGDQRVADMVAYLMSLRDPDFEKEDVFNMPAPATAAERDALSEADRAKLEILDQMVFDYRRRDVGRPQAREELAAMSVEDKLAYAGYRQIRRYGCFGCHYGISDLEVSSATGAEGRTVTLTMKGDLNNAQNIGTELNGWGHKLVNRLDFGLWGHQHDDTEAIPHSRLDWVEAKLKDTRRFDVLPARKEISDGEFTYVPTNRLIQKLPEELLKMPRFPFVDDQEQVDGVVTFLASLVTDVIEGDKLRRLTGREKVLEDGSRLIERLNCTGCHRVGAEKSTMHVDELPAFSILEPGDQHRTAAEKATWLTEEVKLAGKAAQGAEEGTEILLGRNTMLRKPVFDLDTQTEVTNPDDASEPISIVELARRHYELAHTPYDTRVLPVAGYEEGRIGFYYGSGAEAKPSPPTLALQGERVRPDWLFEFFLNVEPIRPAMEARMPSFHLSQDDARTLVRWFKADAELPSEGELFEVDKFAKEPVDLGRSLFGLDVAKGALQCAQCHPHIDSLPSTPALDPKGVFDWRDLPFSIPEDSHYVVWRDPASGGIARKLGFASPEAAKEWAGKNLTNIRYAVGAPWDKAAWGPDLSKVAKRLRPDWVYKWLTDPDAIIPGTKMPKPPYPANDTPEARHKKIVGLIQYIIHMNALKKVESQVGG